MLDSLSQDFSDQMAGWPWVFIHPQNSTFFVDDYTRAKAIKHKHFDLLRGPKQIKHIPSRFPKKNKAMAMLPICHPGIIAVFIHWHALLSLQGIEVPLPSLFQQLPLTVKAAIPQLLLDPCASQSAGSTHAPARNTCYPNSDVSGALQCAQPPTSRDPSPSMALVVGHVLWQAHRPAELDGWRYCHWLTVTLLQLLTVTLLVGGFNHFEKYSKEV